MTREALRVVGVVFVAGCSSGSQPQCLHPCDLGQTLRVEITGDEPAATISVSGDCEANGACPVTTPCRSLDIQLVNGGPGPRQVSDPVCHVTAVSPSGAVVERDVTAQYQDDPCCSGYELGFGSSISLSFSTPDGGAGG
jgi:hypothetical protein